MNKRACLRTMSCALVVAVVACSSISPAQDYAGPPATAGGDAMALLTDEQIDQLLAPVALYPDSLLAVLLPAATYADDVAAAAQWLAYHPDAGLAAIDAQNWDPSVKALAHYPEALKEMGDNPEWVQALGVAFTYQNDQVMLAIQNLRRQAVATGSLQSTAEQQVIVQDDTVEILPASPDFMYVPTYDPTVVYVRRWPLTFGVRYGIGGWLDHDFDWSRRVIYIGDGWHHGWGYSDHRWVRDNSPRPIGGSVRIWSHDVARPRPLLPRALLTGHAPDRAGHTRLSLPAAVAHPPAVATRAQTLWAQEHQASDRGRQSLAPHVPSGRAPAPAPHVTSVHTPTPAPHVPSGRAPVPAPHVTSVHAPTQAFTPTPRRPNTLTTATPPTPTRTPTPRPAHAVTPAHTATPVRTFSSPGPSPSSVAHSSFAPSSGGSAHSDSARGSASLGSPSSSSGRGSGGPSAGPSPATDRTKKPSKR